MGLNADPVARYSAFQLTFVPTARPSTEGQGTTRSPTPAIRRRSMAPASVRQRAVGTYGYEWLLQSLADPRGRRTRRQGPADPPRLRPRGLDVQATTRRTFYPLIDSAVRLRSLTRPLDMRPHSCHHQRLSQILTKRVMKIGVYEDRMGEFAAREQSAYQVHYKAISDAQKKLGRKLKGIETEREAIAGRTDEAEVLVRNSPGPTVEIFHAATGHCRRVNASAIRRGRYDRLFLSEALERDLRPCSACATHLVSRWRRLPRGAADIR